MNGPWFCARSPNSGMASDTRQRHCVSLAPTPHAGRSRMARYSHARARLMDAEYRLAVSEGNVRERLSPGLYVVWVPEILKPDVGEIE